MNQRSLTVLLVVGFLGLVAFAGVVGLIVLRLNDPKADTGELLGVTGTAIGALGALLARTTPEGDTTNIVTSAPIQSAGGSGAVATGTTDTSQE